MSTSIEHTDVGAYALGLLEADDRRSFEAHLAVCELCIVELADLSGMRELFAGLQPVPEDPPDPPVPPYSENVVSMLLTRTAADRRRRISTALLGAAAGVALLAGGVTAGITMVPEQPTSNKAGAQAPAKPNKAPAPGAEAPDAPTQSLVGTAERVSTTDQRTKAAGTVAMQPRAWGTAITFEFSNVRGPQECRLIAVPRKGKGQVVTGWGVPKRGYGVPGSPAPLSVHGGTALQRPDIARFEVRTKNGGKLLTINV